MNWAALVQNTGPPPEIVAWKIGLLWVAVLWGFILLVKIFLKVIREETEEEVKK